MTSTAEQNAKRLINTLDRHTDERTIKILAHYLNYQPEQLVIDIAALKELVKDKPGSKY